MLDSQLEIVQQAKGYLQSVSAKDYQQIMKPHFAGSAGAHMRHILDHYLALEHGWQQGYVDYNKRNRFSDIESDPSLALAKWQHIEHWLEQVCCTELERPLDVVCETSLSHQEFVTTRSTLARELVFVSSHAIHHFSLIGVISSLQGNSIEANFGVAPATATFRRQQA